MSASEVLSLLLRVNLAISVGVVLVAVVRAPIRHLAGARAAYALWLLPLTAGLAVLAPSRSVTAAAQAQIGQATLLLDRASPDWRLAPATILLAVWLAGAAAFAVWLGWRQHRFISLARQGQAGPAVVGWLRPSVVLPADFEARFAVAEREAVMAHERAHIRAQHSRINVAVAAVQSAFWFNPFVHLAAHLSRLDQEFACDASVIDREPALRRIYAETLLKTQLAATPLPLGCYWPARAPHPLTERIAMLVRPAPSRKTRLAFAAGLTLAASVAGLGAWAAQPPRVIAASDALARETLATPVARAIAPKPVAASSTTQTVNRPLAMAAANTAHLVPAAQQSHVVTMPDWISRPSSEDLVSAYPAEALKASLWGAARLNCAVDADGRLADCSVAAEEPLDAGFGDAALKLAPTFQMKPASRDGQPVAGARVVIPIRFAIN